MSISIRIGVTALLVALAVGASAALAGPPTKSGSTVVLTLASREARGLPSSMIAETFAARVKALSKGALVVKISYLSAGGNAPVARQEAHLVGLVRADNDQIAIVAARAFQAQGVTSFEALQTPFLITTQAQMDRATSGDVATQLQSGLPAIGLTGLGLAPEGLRRPFGLRKPLVSPADFAGARLVARPSKLTSNLFRALGATALDLGGPSRVAALANGTVAGVESSLALSADPGLPQGGYTAANLVFYPNVDALVANRAALNRLSAAQRSILRDAASSARAWAIASLTERSARNTYCKLGGTIVTASASAIAALHAEAAPVIAAMRSDPLTGRLIGELSQLSPDPGIAPCSHRAKRAPRAGPTVDAVIPPGVYRKAVTEKQLLAAGATLSGARSNGGIDTLTVTADGYQSLHLDSPYPEDTGTCEKRKMYLHRGLVVIESRGPGCGGDISVAWKLVSGGIEFTREEPPDPVLRSFWSGIVWARVA